MNFPKMDRHFLKDKKRIVVKVGTSSLTYPNRKVNLRFLDALTRQLSDLKNRGKEIVLVTSGAINIGIPKLGVEGKTNFLPHKQAAAAVGQSILMNLYATYFHTYGQVVGQMLLTKGDAVNPKRYFHMRSTLDALLKLGVIPIINENDAVTADEIKIGDNDTLSAIVSSVADADLLIILSDVDGLYSQDPRRNKDAYLLDEVSHFTRELFSSASNAFDSRGTGGMYTKLEAAEICTRSGIDMVIASSQETEVLYRILEGEKIGTLFLGENVHPQWKKREMIIGTNIQGHIEVDAGCGDAILHKGSSILPVGIVKVDGIFTEGDIIAVYCNGKEIARGITHYGVEEIKKIQGVHSDDLNSALGFEAPYSTVVHRNNLIVIH